MSLFAFITSWNEFLGALVMMSKGEFYTLPLVLTTARTQTSLGGTDWGLLQAGVTISIIPCIGIYLLCSGTTSPASSTARSNERRHRPHHRAASAGRNSASGRRPSATSRWRRACRSAPSARRSTGRGGCATRRATHVRDTALKLGFRPNDLAQALHRGKSLTVGMISSDSFGRFTMPIMEGLEACLADEGISVFICNAADDPEREKRHIEQLMGKRVDGLVFTARRADHKPSTDMSRLGVPTLYVYAHVGRSRRGLPRARRPAGRRGSRSRTRAARAASASRMSPDPSGSRRCGCGARATPKRWPRPAFDVLRSSSTAPGPRTGATTRSPSFSPIAANTPDAIFCGSDLIARGVIDGLRERGIAIPGEVAVVGLRQLGPDGDGDAAAAHQRRHEPQSARPRGGRRASWR